MAFNAKISFIFNAQKNGWSESWYKQVDGFDAAMASAINVGKARVLSLGKGTEIEAIRIASIEAPFATSLSTNTGLKVPADNAALPRDTPWNAWLGRCKSAQGSIRQVWFRGLPDAWIVVDATTLAVKLDGPIVGACKKLESALIKEGFCLKAWSKSSDAAPKKPIMLYSAVTGNANATQITSPNHGLVSADYVKIKSGRFNLKPRKKPQGSFYITKLTDDTFTIPFPWDGDLSTYVGAGYVQKRVPILNPITSLAPVRAAKKSTGRAFFVSRGRAQNRQK